MKKKVCILSLLLCTSIHLSAQQKISYTYDAAGNRVLRESKKSIELAQEEVSLNVWKEMEVTSPQKGVYCFKSLYLNPEEIKEIGVYNTEGFKVLSPRFVGNTLTVDLSAVNRKGIYLIKCVYQGQSYSYSLTN